MSWHPIADTFTALGNVPNTFWGVCILGASMYMSVHGHENQAYYFAGIGSTLLGVQTANAIKAHSTSVTTDPTTNTSVKVETNASDQTSKN